MFYTRFHSTLFNNRRNSVLFPEFMGFGYLVANQLINMDGTTVQHTNYVTDYTSLFGDVIMAAEKGPDALTYRYTYGLSRNSVTITSDSKNAETLYWHTDRLNSGRFLTDKLGNVASWADYDAWGRTIGVKPIQIGQRELGIVQSYTGYQLDPALNVYYARARVYDPVDKRFLAIDPIKGTVADPMSMVPYIYVLDNPLLYVDPLGLFSMKAALDKAKGYFNKFECYVSRVVGGKNAITIIVDTTQTALDVAGLIPGVGEVADGINALIYLGRGDYANAGFSAGAMIPFAGWLSTGGKAIRKAVKAVDNAELLAKAATNVPGTSYIKNTGKTAAKTDFYVTPQGKVIPANQYGGTGNSIRPEAKYTGSGKHGVKWNEGPATAKNLNKAQGQWSQKDLDFATQKAITLKPGENSWFDLPSDSTSVVHMPNGTTVPATKIWIRNNGTGTFHGYPST